MHLAGVTVLRGAYRLRPFEPPPHHEDFAAVAGPADRGRDRRRQDKIDAFLPVLDGMMWSGLVTIEKVQVLQYGKPAVAPIK